MQSEAAFQEQVGHPLMHINIPAEQNTTAIYAGAMVKDAPHPEAARTWLAFIRSPEAFRIFQRYGFGRYDAATPTRTSRRSSSNPTRADLRGRAGSPAARERPTTRRGHVNDTVDTPQRRFAPLLPAAALLAGRADDGARQDDRHTGHDDARRRVHRLPRQPGRSNAAAGFPRSRGTPAAYLSAPLAAFADGSRQNPVMQPLSTLLTPHERDAVSAYFASLPAPASIVASTTRRSTRRTPARGSRRARWSQGLPACAQCHGPGGLGVAPRFPPLAGQPAAYIAGQLNGWKHGTRPPGPGADAGDRRQAV